jgi:hypothetical protein
VPEWVPAAGLEEFGSAIFAYEKDLLAAGYLADGDQFPKSPSAPEPLHVARWNREE